MKISLISKKPALYSKLLIRLKEAEKSIRGCSQKEYIPFPVIFEKVCRTFSINKQEAWECLFFLAEFGFIEIVKFHGIKLNFEVKNDR